MDRNWHPAVQVVINGPPQAQAHTSSGLPQRRDKPLSVEEALQYSPMSSSPIFGLDCILRPDVGRPPNTTSINHILQSGRTTLTELNGEVSSGRDESSRLETSREYLQQLLDGDQLTEFKFKVPIASRNGQRSLPTPSSEHTSTRSNLGSFARMMLESTDIAFRYPSVSQTEDEKRSQKASSWNSKAHAAIKSTPASYNQHNYVPSNLSVVIPVKSIPPDADGRIISKRRKLNTDGDDNLAAIRLKDQKEEADAALVKLQDLLHEIFEAEDQLEPGTASATTAEQSNAVFMAPRALDITGSLLSSDIHSRLQKAIRKVVGFNRLQDIPSDYLNRIQKLCEKPVIAAQSPDLGLEDPSNDSEAQEWLKKIDDMHNALLAVGTLLLTMSGSQTERDLCPEDLIEAIPNVLNQTFDHCVIPAVEARPGGKEAHHFEFFSAQKRVIGGLIQQSKKALALFADFLSRIDVSEGTVTAAEFFACKLIFVENSHTEKDSAVGFQKYESVRRGAMDVLAKVFSKYPAQRPFILDEILVSLEKLPSTRQSARQFKLADGKNIQLLTALVMQLVQTTALDVPTSRSSRTKSKLPSSGDDDEDEQLDDARGKEDDDGTELSMEQLATKVNRLYDNAVRSAQYIVKFIVQRAMTSTKTGDQPYRNILDLFTEDLIGVLGSTDWPAAELLLRIMASHMVGIADLDKSPATAKSMALELLGWMGSAISDLIVTAQHLLPTMEESDSELTDYLKQLFEDYSGHALHPQDLVVSEGPYRITLEYFLQVRHLDDWQLTSARGYYLAQWAKSFCSVYYNADERDDVTYDDMTENLVDLFAKFFSDPLWLETHR